MKNQNLIYGIIIGFFATIVLFLGFSWIKNKGDKNVQNDYYVITNQIKRMNKMVVTEQDFSTMQRTKITRELLGGMIPGTEKSIITFTKTNAQVSYDLNQMKIEVDSVNRKLIITHLPKPEIRIIPSVEIQSMDDSFIDRFSEEDLKKITQTAKQKAYQQVDQKQLTEQGQKQLKENLNQIFVLAKALHYSIEDKTGLIDASQL